MHETRNFVIILAVGAAGVWSFIAWFGMGDETASRDLQRIIAPIALLALISWLIYAMMFEDAMPNHMKSVVGDIYYEADGLSFMPMVRVQGKRAELSLYYQNRFENPVEAIVHLRPPADMCVLRPGVQDIHFAFRAGGGDFGVIHQPIAVPEHLQGEVLNAQLAAATYYPRSHGNRLNKHAGMPCGTLLVDWGGAAFRTGVHEVSGEIELIKPCHLHLSMPKGVAAELHGREVWRQEVIATAKS